MNDIIKRHHTRVTDKGEIVTTIEYDQANLMIRTITSTIIELSKSLDQPEADKLLNHFRI